MKKVFLISLLLVSVYSCNDSNSWSNEGSAKEKGQLETLEAGLLMMPDELLSLEQKDLKAKIYQVVLEGVEADTIQNHLCLTFTKKEFKERGLDESLYWKCLDEINAVNNYADETGQGKEMMKSWIVSKENYLQRSVDK